MTSSLGLESAAKSGPASKANAPNKIFFFMEMPLVWFDIKCLWNGREPTPKGLLKQSQFWMMLCQIALSRENGTEALSCRDFLSRLKMIRLFCAGRQGWKVFPNYFIHETRQICLYSKTRD